MKFRLSSCLSVGVFLLASPALGDASYPVDASDGRTVLDYVGDEREKARGTSNEAVMQRYYEMLRREGAKHRREL